jgi:signal transduction histidine kinase/CheY-like chemotaxis protein
MLAAPLDESLPALAPASRREGEAALRERARDMYAYNATSLAGHLVGALVVEWVYLEVAPPALRGSWGAVFALLWLTRALYAWHIARGEPASIAGVRTRLRIWSLGVLLSAAMWGAAAWLFYDYGEALHQVALVVVVYTFCVACVPILAPQFRLYLLFVALAFLPAIGRVALQETALALQTAAVMFVAMAVTVLLGRNHRAVAWHLGVLQRRTAVLMEQLRAEKLAADAARHEAEVANRAKTQFFTAASHDLRQPLHAMGLFAEALRQRIEPAAGVSAPAPDGPRARTSHEPDVAQLVHSINESVDALDGLFSELLDITRIDSGGIEVRPEHFAFADILRGLRLHYEPAAFEKGLALRLRGGHHVVHADPLLVTRVLRNLVSNAIRYTEDGVVLVSCRRRGERLRLQVWDSGPGIQPAEQARIFEEFYQVPNTTPIAAGQRKGLGLGLAIVLRLARLMQAPLELRSVPGRGSVFTLEVPAGVAPRARAPEPAHGFPAGLTLGGRLIVIVEDDAAVRAGLEVLLRGWGASLLAFESVAAAEDWAAGRNATRPALLLVDYRLEGGRSGVDAIAALRRRFGASLPAIVMTGSTMSDHEAAAQQHDFHLLLKPVLPTKLRAMIAFKLAAGATQGERALEAVGQD